MYNNTPVDYMDWNTECLFREACDRDNIFFVEHILKNKKINIKNGVKKTFLHIACEYKNKSTLEIIKYLVEIKETDVNALDHNHNTPLHYVCKNEFVEAAGYLIYKNANIRILNYDKISPNDIMQEKDISGQIYSYEEGLEFHEKICYANEQIKIFLENHPEVIKNIIESTKKSIGK